MAWTEKHKWYDISADGGETWTTQYLSKSEVAKTKEDYPWYILRKSMK